MTGERLYAAHRDYAATLNERLLAWEQLDGRTRMQWEIRAYEQNLRDRPLTATLLGDQPKDAHYDGCYAD